MNPSESTAGEERQPVTIADTLAQSETRELETAEAVVVLDLNPLPVSLLAALQSLFEKQGQDITIYETTSLTPFYSWAVLCTGLSSVQSDVLARTVREDLHKVPGAHLLSQEGSGESGWVLMDYRDFLIHIQSPEQRRHYNLDRLWDDLPTVRPTEADVKAALAGG